MKFLWVNNVCSILGGTLNATLSMVCSFPDADHTVFGFGSRFGSEEYEAFPDGVKLVSGSNLQDFVRNKKFDVIVFQNTPIELMPNRYLNKPLTVYYQHSNHRSAKQAREKCDIFFCVSNYLANLADVSTDHVLYQPVTVPQKIEDEEYEEWSKQFASVAGRICTPNPNKWKKEDVVGLVEKVGFNNGIGFHFVGATDPIKEAFKGNEAVYFSNPSFKARGYLREWDYLLYKSQQTETYGRVVKEAQRSMCIPIVSNHSGFKEQIDNAVTGFLCNDDHAFIGYLQRQENEDHSVVNVDEMKHIASKTSSLKIWREEFLRRLENNCTV